MPTEVWFRNPNNYIRELVECGVGNVAWDRGALVKKGIDPEKHAQLYFGQAIPYRLLLIGSQGTAELRPGRGIDKPVGVYPTWSYGESIELLEEIIARPVGQDPDICNDLSVPPDERPVLGQEHRVVVTDLPPSNHGPGRKMLTVLKELQEEYPDCILHVHGIYSWRISFGMGFRSTDVEPRTAAQKGRVILVGGNEEQYERVQQHAKWVTLLGFKPADLSVPRNRCMYNIKSALWAGENYEKLFRFRVRSSGNAPDTETPRAEYKPEETTKRTTLPVLKMKEGDKFYCDTCSIQMECKYQRAGAVCTVPDAEPASLANFFKTRDPQLIVDGLSTIVAANSRRLERGMSEEEIIGDLNPEVTKLLNSVFTQGVQLAKLLDPNLRGGGVKVNVGVGVQAGGQASVAVSAANPNELIGGVVRALEARGIPRDKITPELVQQVLESSADPSKATRAIEGSLVSKGE